MLLAELHMPDMDGYQLTSAIRVQEGTKQHGVIIALTADVLKGGAQQCRDAGMDDYVCKPARLSEMKAILEKWLPQGRNSRRFAPPKLPGARSAKAPPLDIAVLEEFVGRDPDVIREFLRAFWMSTSKTADELTAACEVKDGSLVADLAHKLKSPARSVGALRLASLCDEIQSAAAASDFGSIQSLLPQFVAEKANVEEYMREA